MDELSLEDDADKSSEAEEELGEFAKDRSQDKLLLYEAESQVLTLYDQLADLRLEKALFEAQAELQSGTTIVPCHERYSLNSYLQSMTLRLAAISKNKSRRPKAIA